MSDQGFGVARQLVDQQSRVSKRDVPFQPLELGAEATFATVPARQLMKVRRLAVANTESSAGTVSIWVKPPGGTKIAQLVDFPVNANSAADLTDLIGGLYTEGTVITAAGTTGMVLSGWYEAVQ